MIFYAGLALIALSIVLLVKFLINGRRPKTEAKVLGLLKEAPAGQFIEQPHAVVEYHYQNTKYNGKVLLRSKPQVGDTIKLAIKPDAPAKAAEYYPKAEKMGIIGSAVLGIVLVVVALVVSDMLK